MNEALTTLAARVARLRILGSSPSARTPGPSAEKAIGQGTQLLVALLAAEADGHTRLPCPSKLFDRKVLEQGGDPIRLRRALLDPESLLRPLWEGDDAPMRRNASEDGVMCVQSARTLAEELAIVESLAQLTSTKRDSANSSSESALEEIFSAPVTLHGLQRDAVISAMANRFSIITGGPGTGKTAVVFALLRALCTGGLEAAHTIRPERVRLAAPTGKAAQRLFESLRNALAKLEQGARPASHAAPFGEVFSAIAPPATLHRLLAWDPVRYRFFHDRASPLEADLVIVDEASMIDQSMFRALLEALPPQAKLVLLGDPDQLPSVGAGAVLRDLVARREADHAPVARRETEHAPDARREADHAPVARREAEHAPVARRETEHAPVARRETDAEAAWPFSIVRLTESFRMDPKRPGGRHVLLFAQAVLRTPAVNDDGSARFAPGREAMPKVHLGYEGFLAAGKAMGVHILPPTDATLASLVDASARVFFQGYALSEAPFVLVDGELAEADLPRARALLAVHERFRILSPLRELPKFGVRPLNEAVHDAYMYHARTHGQESANLPSSSLRTKSSRTYGSSERFLRGEPVMITENDFVRALWNGDQGVVVLAQRGDSESSPHLEVLFPRGDGAVLYPLASVRENLVHAYALTVHKAQGSEFDRIVLVLPPEGHPLADRANLYTAATRAREAVVLVTGGVGLHRAATTKTERHTSLGHMLTERFATV